MMRTLIALAILVSSSLALPTTALPQQDNQELRKRAEAGDPKAQVELGIVCASGDGVTGDDAEAVKWFRKAAEKGDAAGEYSLAEMLLLGRGASQDLAEASRWMRRAAENGDARGQYNLAVLYAQGQGIPQDDNAAAKWMRRAADQGSSAGQFGLGSMYAHGKGVPKSEKEAVTWYRRAADQGDGPAMNNLAFLLATTPDPDVRDPRAAVTVAQKLLEAEPDNPSYLDTTATAYFENGQAVRAAEMERKALVLKPDKGSYKDALKKYETASQR